LSTEAVHSHKHTEMSSSYSSVDCVVTMGHFHCALIYFCLFVCFFHTAWRDRGMDLTKKESNS